MLRWISILGGLLIMMGQHDRSEALFYYFRLEDQVPEHHLLRLIDYLYGITSERKLVEELRMHLAWRWFTGLGFDQEIPHHSTFSKNRHGRFQESKLFEQLFEQIVRQCVEVGLVQGKDLSVDGSFIEANAAKESRIPREQLAEAAQVHRSVRQYLKEVNSRIPWKNRCMNKIRCRPRIPIPPMPPRAEHRLGWVLRQLSSRQPQLRDRGSTGNGSANEPGNRGSTRH